jgi:hypothetical protein
MLCRSNKYTKSNNRTVFGIQVAPVSWFCGFLKRAFDSGTRTSGKGHENVCYPSKNY